MPSRKGTPVVGAGTPAPEEKKVNVQQSSPLKIASHKFMMLAKVFDQVLEETERMVKVGDQKIPSLYVTFTNDQAAHKAALLFLQEGDEHGGTADELFCGGFQRSEPGDDLILMFQFIPRESLDIPLSLVSPEKQVKTLLAECGVTGKIEALPDAKDQPKGVVVTFTNEDDTAQVAWHYIASDTLDGEKQNPLFCIGEKGENLALAFYSVATA